MPAIINTPSTLSEIYRLLLDLIKVGTVGQVQLNPPRVRVIIGELVTDWRPWFNIRAGGVKTAFVPSVGEQCMVFSPGGNIGAGFVLLGLNSDENPPPECGANDFVINVPAGGKLLLQCGGSTFQLDEQTIKQVAQRIELN